MPETKSNKTAWITRKRYRIKEGDSINRILVIKIYYDKDGNKIKATSKIL
tara:strand:- start:823 stop:972 length:150 start_codon:yes stop_codon:yes gene_type:complete